MLIDTEELSTEDILVSVSPLTFIDNAKFMNWLRNGYAADMTYLSNEDSIRKREDPSLIMKNSKSIITFVINYKRHYYYNEKYGRISKYALGLDYHIYVKKIIDRFIENNNLYITNYKSYVDTGPILERELAFRSGRGWIGRNSMFINMKMGSFTFLGESLTDLKINSFDVPSPDLCGKCNKCIVSCPTQAINPDRTIDSRKCIAYNNIENRDIIPPSIALKMSDMIFGCDICNDVCPWNNNSKISKIKEVSDYNFGNIMSVEDMAFIDKYNFEKLYKNSSLKRAGYQGLARNAVIALYNKDKNNPVLKEIEKNFNDLRTKQIKILKTKYNL